MALEGPAFVLRWRDAVHDDVSGVIAPARIDAVAELAYRLGADHPEGAWRNSYDSNSEI
jgi:Protein of unknown function (DUF3616)